jgi:hypothetical protein
VESFVENLLPLLEIKDVYIVKLVEIKLETPDSEISFMKLIDQSIEKMLLCKQIREKSISII